MEHVTKIFQFIQNVDLEDTHNAAGEEIKTLTGMHSAEKEYVPFEKPVALEGKVEMCLHRVIDGMWQALRVIMKEAINGYPSMDRVKFVLEYQGQIVITGCQANWCIETEKVFVDISCGEKDAMPKYNDFRRSRSQP